MAGGPATATPSRRSARFRPVAEINVTSLVDITLVLLITFMLTAPLIQGGVEVDLPSVRGSATARQEGMVVTLDAQRQVFLDEDPIPMANLTALVLQGRSAYPEGAPVYLRSDEDVPYGFVVEVMGELKSAGVEELQLVVEQRGKE